MTCHLFDGSCQDCEEPYCQDTIDEIRYDYLMKIEKIRKIKERIASGIVKISTVKAGIKYDTEEHRTILYDLYDKHKDLINE